jgi:transcriptional regulator with XRE-family HTH domain
VALLEGVRLPREARKRTPAQLADRAGLNSWKYIGTVKNARTNITLTNVVKLAAGLGVSVPELMEARCQRDEQRKELLATLLKLVAREDDKMLQLLRGVLAQVKKAAG